ncbi:hypothetical protein ACYSNX_12980 [Myroides sp. LJL115]
MTLNNIPLYNFSNGALMILIFVIVCVLLVVALILFISSGKTSDKQNNISHDSSDKQIEEKEST